MTPKALHAVWSSQLPLLSNRVKVSWFSQLGHIQESTSEANAHDAGLLAKGFVVALFETGLIGESGANLLDTTSLSAKNAAISRLRGSRK